MELKEIIKRLSEQVKTVDRNITPTQPYYIPSIGSSSEPTIVQRLVTEWAKKHPNELPGIVLKKRGKGNDGCFEINYPVNNRHKLDFGFSSSTGHQNSDNSPSTMAEILSFIFSFILFLYY